MVSENSVMVAVGARIREAREASGLAQWELADRVGVSQTAVSFWESGKRVITLDDLVVVGEVLRVEPAVLLPDGPTRGAVQLDADGGVMAAPWRVGVGRDPRRVHLVVPAGSAELDADDIMKLRHALALAYCQLTGSFPPEESVSL